MQGTRITGIIGSTRSFRMYFTVFPFAFNRNNVLEVIVKGPGGSERGRTALRSRSVSRRLPLSSRPLITALLFLFIFHSYEVNQRNVLPKYVLNESFMYKNLSPIGYACTRTSRPLRVGGGMDPG